MFNDDKNDWKGKGWGFLAAEFIGNINRMMAMKVKEKIKEEKIMLEKKIVGLFLISIGLLIFFWGIAILISLGIGLAWTGPVIVGGGLIIISLILFKS